jgi:hypothetical protein
LADDAKAGKLGKVVGDRREDTNEPCRFRNGFRDRGSGETTLN